MGRWTSFRWLEMAGRFDDASLSSPTSCLGSVSLRQVNGLPDTLGAVHRFLIFGIVLTSDNAAGCPSVGRWIPSALLTRLAKPIEPTTEPAALILNQIDRGFGRRVRISIDILQAIGLIVRQAHDKPFDRLTTSRSTGSRQVRRIRFVPWPIGGKTRIPATGRSIQAAVRGYGTIVWFTARSGHTMQGVPFGA